MDGVRGWESAVLLLYNRVGITYSMWAQDSQRNSGMGRGFNQGGQLKQTCWRLWKLQMCALEFGPLSSLWDALHRVSQHSTRLWIIIISTVWASISTSLDTCAEVLQRSVQIAFVISPPGCWTVACGVHAFGSRARRSLMWCNGRGLFPFKNKIKLRDDLLVVLSS